MGGLDHQRAGSLPITVAVFPDRPDNWSVQRLGNFSTRMRAELYIGDRSRKVSYAADNGQRAAIDGRWNAGFDARTQEKAAACHAQKEQTFQGAIEESVVDLMSRKN